MVLFELPMRGSWLLLLLSLALFLAGALGMGLLISAIAETPAGRVPDRAAVVVPADDHALGLHLPDLRACRSRCRSITYIVPARYFLVALRGVLLKGAGIDVIWPAARRAGDLRHRS